MDILNKTNIQNKILRAPEFGDEGGGGASSSLSNVINIGGVEVDKFYLGNSDDVKIYLGDVKLYPRNIPYKLVAQYNDTTEYKVVCNGYTTLSTTDTRGHTTPISAMTSAVVSGCVTQIGLNAFSGASSLTSLTLSDDITRFNNQAFMYTSSLTDFTFPSSLTYLGGSTFRYSGIRKFNNRIPSGVTALPSGCFADMYSLSAITIPSSIVSGSTNVFLRDSGLTEVHFERTTPPALDADTFKGCTALIKIYIPSCDCYDAYAADSQFSGLTNLIYAEDNTKCLTYTPSVKITTVGKWTHTEDSNGNTTYILKTASSSSELTTCTFTISGVTNITFTQKNAVSGSGIEYSSSVDNFATKTQVRTTGQTWGLTNLDPSKTYTIKCRLLAKMQGQYITGTNASANITWS